MTEKEKRIETVATMAARMYSAALIAQAIRKGQANYDPKEDYTHNMEAWMETAQDLYGLVVYKNG